MANFTLWVQFEDNSVQTSQHNTEQDAQKELHEILVSADSEVYTYEINPNIKED